MIRLEAHDNNLLTFTKFLFHQFLKRLVNGDHAVEPAPFHDFLNLIKRTALDVVLEVIGVDTGWGTAASKFSLKDLRPARPGKFLLTNALKVQKP